VDSMRLCVVPHALRSGQTGQTPHVPPVPLMKSHFHTAQQQGTGVHVPVHVSPLL
jgi:hypothetical protein